ncbi:hypothetical protein M413DRAFT_444924 [Hebeloma cylindrosporum]|uniref:PARP catalytic domain-containing protein n=1 Tax=Hebeloma cylindrosporum TaxID=76867 RepID=A0A0C3CDL5_HEBCY|nr:hypothetical protein M413DRAFT_444924 [Hebeloma cylindrosporum h7]
MSLLHSQPAPLPTPINVHNLTDDEFEDVDDDDLSLHGLDDEQDSLYQPGIDVCIVCRKRPPYSKGGKKYPTCGLTCAGVLETALNQHTPLPPPSSPRNGGFFSSFGSRRGRGGAPSTSSGTTRHPPQLMPGAFAPSPQPHYPQSHHLPRSPQPSRRPRGHHAPDGSTRVQYSPPQRSHPCVICKTSSCYGGNVTCGAKCTEKLFTNGPPDPKMCNYCHRRPKVSGHDQCGDTCKASAKVACLLCKSRPKHKSYHLCGKTCKEISVKSTPLLLEAPPGHASYTMVENKFKAAYAGVTALTIKHVYKIIENKSFLQPYDAYKNKVGNEVFRYHGTKRSCTLGINGNTKLCSGSCNLCSILRTSFKTSLAGNGCFGRGLYSSSSPQKASGYMGGTGAMILTKVVLGNVWDVCARSHVTALPSGYDSVVYNPANAPSSNETIVYTDDAIRPVFLIIF